jgi:hypothetical protein
METPFSLNGIRSFGTALSGENKEKLEYQRKGKTPSVPLLMHESASISGTTSRD